MEGESVTDFECYALRRKASNRAAGEHTLDKNPEAKVSAKIGC
jgi:hypothetical protein